MSNGNEIRTTSATGGQKGAKDARFDLVPVSPITELAELYGVGAKKYAAHNWRNGYDWSLSYAAAMRHLTQFWNGEDRDEEMGSKHVINAVFHLFALAQFMDDFPEYDDRFKKPKTPEEDKGWSIPEAIDWTEVGKRIMERSRSNGRSMGGRPESYPGADDGFGYVVGIPN